MAVQFGRAFGCFDLKAPPVAILPHPDREGVPERALKNTDSVMAINSHLVGEDALVNHAAGLTAVGGTLHLTHVEDDAVFERYLDVISKIPEIDTDVARETIQNSCCANLRLTLIPAKPLCAKPRGFSRVVKHVTHGHRLEEYRSAIEDHQVDLVVLQGHDEDQLAHERHGLFRRRGAAYHPPVDCLRRYHERSR